MYIDGAYDKFNPLVCSYISWFVLSEKLINW